MLKNYIRILFSKIIVDGRSSARFLLVLMSGFLLLNLAGCAANHYVQVRNESDTDITVRLYVGDRGAAGVGDEGQIPLYHTEKHLAHLRVGQSTRFLLRKNKFYKSEAREPVIRLWVESRAPVFAADPEKMRQHWLELVSFPPAEIIVEGVRSDLKFYATRGEITFVPKQFWLEEADPYSTNRQVSVEGD